MPNNLLSPQFFKISLHSHPTPPLPLISLSSLVSPYILSSLLLIYLTPLTHLTAQQNLTKLSHPILKLPSPYSHSSHLTLLPKSQSPYHACPLFTNSLTALSFSQPIHSPPHTPLYPTLSLNSPHHTTQIGRAHV